MTARYWIEKIGEREVACQTCNCCGGKRTYLDREVRRVPQAVIDEFVAERALQKDAWSRLGNYMLGGLMCGILCFLATLGIGVSNGFDPVTSAVIGAIPYFAFALGILQIGRRRAAAASAKITQRIAKLLWPHVQEADISKAGTFESGASIILEPEQKA